MFFMNRLRDKLSYGTGTVVGSNLLGELTGLSIPEPLYIDDSAIWFRFESDTISGGGAGFYLTWNATGKLPV